MQSSEFKLVRISDNGTYLDLQHLSDAKLRTDDGCIFDIHRAILAMNSDYFRTMFCGMDRDRIEFMIPGVRGECLCNILWYIYTRDIRVTENNVRELLIAADYLLLKDLQVEIKQSIRTSMNELNCLIFLVETHQTNNEDIFSECFRFIQTRFEGVVRTQKEELTDLPLEILRAILSNRSLYVYNEATVWHAIVEWTLKDIPSRMCCVPQLLLTLAMEDIGEELASEILQHEIIAKNSLMEDLLEMRASSSRFSSVFSFKLSISNRDVFISYLRSYKNRFNVQSQPYQPYSHRIPLNLHVIASYDQDKHKTELYITYDENIDLWRKIAEVRLYPHSLVTVGHNIYIFAHPENICKNFDLSVMNWVTMDNFRNFYKEISCVEVLDSYIYIFGETFFQNGYVVEVYNTANKTWSNGLTIPDIFYGEAVVIDKKIYFVGYTLSDGMVTLIFDPVTQQWSPLSPPAVKRSHFVLVAYHQKVYLLGGMTRKRDCFFANAEVYDPATDLWRELPDMPQPYTWPTAVVFNDQIIAFDGGFEHVRCKENFLWNDEMECWEKFDKIHTFESFWIISVDDVETIRMITKQNRDPKTHMMKSPFN